MRNSVISVLGSLISVAAFTVSLLSLVTYPKSRSLLVTEVQTLLEAQRNGHAITFGSDKRLWYYNGHMTVEITWEAARNLAKTPAVRK